MMGTMRRVRTAAVGVAGVLLLLTACTSPADRPPRHEPGPGAGLSADDAIAEVLDGLGTDAVISVEPDATPAPGNDNLPGLEVHVAGDPEDPARKARADWLTELCAGAVSALMRTDESHMSQVVDRVYSYVNLPNGRTRFVGGGTGTGDWIKDYPDLDDADVVAHVDQVLGQFGLVRTTVEVLRPLDSAVVITARLDERSMHVDWTFDELLTALEGDPIAYEGTLLEIDSYEGTPLIVSGVARRVGSGGGWFADGMDDVFGITVLGGPVD